MKTSTLILSLLISVSTFAQSQQTHGKIYGIKPSVAGMQDATKVEAFMGRKPVLSTTIRGRVLNVTKQKGGWFTIDAGDGKTIGAYFKNNGINLPADLKGKTVIAEGVVSKLFLASDLQHFAGDTVSGKKQHTVKADPKRALKFEVRGLMVER